MSKRKKRKQRKPSGAARKAGPTSGGPGRRDRHNGRTLGYWLVVLILSLGLGVGIVLLSNAGDHRRPASPSFQPPTDSGDGSTDRFGRSPGDPHYGHSHP